MKVINLKVDRGREENLKYVVIAAKYNKEWVYVRHRDRDTWEIPGGHIEENETVHEAASRELFEESGALEFDLYDICDYGVIRGGNHTFGRLLYADIKKLGELPDSEIGEVMLGKHPEKWTYEAIQPILFDLVNDWLGGEND